MSIDFSLLEIWKGVYCGSGMSIVNLGNKSLFHIVANKEVNLFEICIFFRKFQFNYGY